jgi:enolase
MSTQIAEILARQVWDSRGRPTVEAEVILASGMRGRAIAPSGASTGSREALDRRDGGRRLGGFGVNGALASIRDEIAPLLRGREARDQRQLDQDLIALDGTPQKRRLGGNAVVAVSLALAQASANAAGMPLWQHLRHLAGFDMQPHIPLPMIQIFGGGRHAVGSTDLQDFLVLCPNATSFSQAIEMTAEVYLAAGSIMKARGQTAGIADEGGHWPLFDTNEAALETLTEAIHRAGYGTPGDVAIAVDVAASSFADHDGYHLSLERRRLDGPGFVDLLADWTSRYPIVSIEDPLREDDDAGFAAITRQLGGRLQIVGDDYLATSAAKIEEAGAAGACNTALLKVNQCGTVSELIDAALAARRLGWNSVQSGRSGESEDISLAHLAVGLLSDQIKVGSMARSERTAKWNEVLRIEETMPHGALRQFRLPGVI